MLFSATLSLPGRFLRKPFTGLDKQFELFNLAWAIAVLFHMANQRVYTHSLSYFLLTISAILLLAKPSSVGRLMLLIFMQLFQVIVSMPAVPNHWIFMAFVNLTIVQAMIYQAVKTKTFLVDKELLLKTFAPVVRVEVLVLYFYVVFHKLNSGFFNPDISCATDFLVAQDSSGITNQSKQFLVLNAYISIGAEAIIPLLLVFRKTRDLGLLLGLVFHCILAFNPINGFYDISSMIFGTYILFTSPNFTNEVYRWYDQFLKWKDRIHTGLSRFTVPKLAVITMGVAAILGILIVLMWYLNTKDFFREFFWTAFNIVFIGPFVFSMLRKNKPAVIETKYFSMPSWSFIVFPVIVFLNGLTPYLGLKTENAYAMFSNLRTEGGKTNHYLVPVSTQIFDYQKDLVEIVSSTDPLLNKIKRENQLMVYFSFKNYINSKKPMRVEYLRNGEKKIFEWDNPITHGDLLQRDSRFLRKIMNYRTISKYEPQPCNH
ncbi:MAG: hypothetical protein Q7T76_02315 [Ferruginibacter sp.]|nr:hypothetical protein [Ferruginibacter sp.]